MNEAELPYVIGRLDARMAELQDRMDRQARWQEAREARSDELFDRQEVRYRETIERIEAKIDAEGIELRKLIAPIVTHQQHVSIGTRVLKGIGLAAVVIFVAVKTGDVSGLKVLFGASP